MDLGTWITWYDLPQTGRDAYLSWLHGDYMPRVLARPGVLWGAHYASQDKPRALRIMKDVDLSHVADTSVPAGDRYILMFGATHAHTFAVPPPDEFHASLAANDRSMLALRIGERVNIMTEVARVDGPEASRHSGGLAPAACVQLGSFNCQTYQDEAELAAWYAQWRMLSTMTLPGCVRTRQLASVAGWAKHAILYEFVSLEARNEYFPKSEDNNPAMKAWTAKVIRKLVHAPGSSNLACRIWPE